tara:strand:+ start:655 stop:1185 length:531 start_codon:yes stop_codon:yes gene_type:complete
MDSVKKVKKSLGAVGQKIQKRKVANDVFITPLPLAKLQIDMVVSDPWEVWMDPFKNDGSYFNQFPDTQYHKWTEILEGRDFFTFKGEVDVICSNPPFSLINKCIEKFVELKPRVISILIGTMNVTPRRMEYMEKSGYTLTQYKIASWKPIIGMAVILQWEKTDFNVKSIGTYLGRF